MPTETPPPYFPQNTLSPGDEKTQRKVKFALYGCIFLFLVGLAGLITGAVYLIKWLW